MRKLLILALFAMVACCARAQTYHNCTTTITAASISCTFSFSAGDYWYMQTGGFVGGVITPPTGCGPWLQAAPDNLSNGTDMGYYWQYFTSSGSCTVTESPTGVSGGTALGMGIVGVSGLPAYAPEAMIPSIGAASPLVATQTSSQAGDVALFLGMANNSSTLAVSGYATQGSNFVSNVSLGQFSATLGAAGSQTATMTTTNDPPKGIFVLLRTSVPSQGFQQINSNTCSACAGSISVTLPFASASGDLIRIAGGASAVFSAPTNNAGQPTCYQAPGAQGFTAPPTTWNCPVVSPPTTPITYTMSFSGSAAADLIVWEVAGPPSTHYVATNSGLQSRDIGPTSVSAGPIFIRQNGSYYIDSIVSGTVNSPFRPYTPSTGFMTRGFFPLNSQITGVYDGVFSVTGSGDSFNSTVSIVNGSDSLSGAWMWAYALGSQYQDIEIAQTASDNNGRGEVAGLLTWNEPTSGCSLIISGQTDGGTTWSLPSGSPSLSWRILQGGGSGQTYALWEADSVPSGAITTNINSSAGSRSAGVKVCNSGPSTGSAALTSASSSVGPLSISSTTGSPMILGFGGLAGNGSGAYIAASSSQIYAINQYGFSDDISTAAYSFLATTPTTTSLTISDPASASSNATVMLVAMPSSFAPTPSSLIIQGATLQGLTAQ